MLISELYAGHLRVTLDALMEAMETQWIGPPFYPWIWGRTTLWRVLQRMGYTCSPGANHYHLLREKASIVVQRTRYIREVQALRAAGHVIF